MSDEFWTGLEGDVLKSKRDYRVAAAVLGREVVCLIYSIEAGNSNCYSGRSDYLMGADSARASHAARMAAQAAHYARRGATTLIHPDERAGAGA
jgi:hypothetical protein